MCALLGATGCTELKVVRTSLLLSLGLIVSASVGCLYLFSQLSFTHNNKSTCRPGDWAERGDATAVWAWLCAVGCKSAPSTGDRKPIRMLITPPVSPIASLTPISQTNEDSYHYSTLNRKVMLLCILWSLCP